MLFDKTKENLNGNKPEKENNFKKALAEIVNGAPSTAQPVAEAAGVGFVNASSFTSDENSKPSFPSFTSNQSQPSFRQPQQNATVPKQEEKVEPVVKKEIPEPISVADRAKSILNAEKSSSGFSFEKTETPKVEPAVHTEVKKETTFSENNGDEEKTIIGKGVKIDGNIKAPGSIEIHGIINGSIESDGDVSVISGQVQGNITGKSAKIDNGAINGEFITVTKDLDIKNGSNIVAKLTGDNVSVDGSVKGDVIASGKILLEKNSKLVGDVTGKSLEIKGCTEVTGKFTISGE